MRTHRHILGIVLATAMALSACGGSDGPTAPTRGDGQVALESFKLLETARTEILGAPEIRLDESLSAVATRHSEAMRDQGFLGHTDPRDGGLRERLRGAGVPFSSAAENLVQVSDRNDPAGLAHAELMASPSHREHILDGRFLYVGIGVARLGDQYWVTQIFIAR